MERRILPQQGPGSRHRPVWNTGKRHSSQRSITILATSAGDWYFMRHEKPSHSLLRPDPYPCAVHAAHRVSKAMGPDKLGRLNQRRC